MGLGENGLLLKCISTRFPKRDSRRYSWLGRTHVHLRHFLRPDILRVVSRSKPTRVGASTYQLCLHLRCVPGTIESILVVSRNPSEFDLRTRLDYRVYFEVRRQGKKTEGMLT